MQYDRTNKTHKLVLAGLLAAFIMVLTMVVKIPIPNMAGAYLNLGDAGVYLAACLLGNPYAALCAGVGSAVADLLLGSALYAVPTFVIKGAMAFVAAMLLERLSGKRLRRLISLTIAGLIMPLGYFLFEAVLYGPVLALAGMPMNLLQYAAGVALGAAATRAAESYIAVTGGKIY